MQNGDSTANISISSALYGRQNSTENESFSVPLRKRIHAVRKHQLEGDE